MNFLEEALLAFKGHVFVKCLRFLLFRHELLGLGEFFVFFCFFKDVTLGNLDEGIL